MLLFLFSLIQLSATSASEPTIDERLRHARSECYERNWEREECEYRDPQDGWDYSRGIGDDLLEYASARWVYGLSDLGHFVVENATPLSTIISQTDPKRIFFKNFLHELRQKAKQLKLSQCKRSCLAKCMTANLMHYEDYAKSIIMNDQDLFFNGKGVCREFATLGDTLQEAVGIKSRWKADLDYFPEKKGIEKIAGHAYLKVKIDGKSYYVEPQDDSCTFYKIE